ncbi:MAG: lipopolysaccharide assembly protein LapA domain-containing protein [Candidatus Daviesbacteria bacterium]|nr:lipopolysaccharide assembly protein LapA domain-containing protein [Candidatus Daviesbacteria bacterium]
MATLIVTVLFGLIIAYFAIQNTGAISLNFLNYTVPSIPTYIVVVGALLVGLLLSWIISLVKDITTGFTIRGKESKIKDYGKENTELLKLNHQLELENARLMAETKAPEDDKSL